MARVTALAAGLVTVAALFAIVVIRMTPRNGPPPAPHSSDDDVVAQAPAPAELARRVVPPAPAPAEPPRAAGEPPKRLPAAAPRALPSVVPPLVEIGEPGTGVQVFPPPGTKPIKRGIVVPEGFELPPGYVRHYQSSDDGTQLPPILMFHPDFQPKDANGQPVPVPSDRVVPPDMAPPGMPVKILEVPPASG